MLKSVITIERRIFTLEARDRGERALLEHDAVGRALEEEREGAADVLVVFDDEEAPEQTRRR